MIITNKIIAVYLILISFVIKVNALECYDCNLFKSEADSANIVDRCKKTKCEFYVTQCKKNVYYNDQDKISEYQWGCDTLQQCTLELKFDMPLHSNIECHYCNSNLCNSSMRLETYKYYGLIVMGAIILNYILAR